MIPVDHQPPTIEDFRGLFRVLSTLDGHERKTGDAEAWMLAARAGRWTRAQVAAATLGLATSFTGFRVQPGHLAEQIAANRARIRGRWECPDPPRELADDPVAELVWRRRAAASFADRALLAMAAGGPVDEVPLLLAPEPSGSRLLLTEAAPAVRAEIERVLPTVGQLPESRPAPRRAPRAAMDPARRAEALAELNTRRPAVPPNDIPDSPSELREDVRA